MLSNINDATDAHFAKGGRWLSQPASQRVYSRVGGAKNRRPGWQFWAAHGARVHHQRRGRVGCQHDRAHHVGEGFVEQVQQAPSRLAREMERDHGKVSSPPEAPEVGAQMAGIDVGRS